MNLSHVGYNHLYRALDVIAEKKETLEQALFERERSLFNMQVDVVFYDVTTFYCESTSADSLKDFGFSKDGKFKEVQVVLGLITDCEGRPVGYELFPGDTFDGKSTDTDKRGLKLHELHQSERKGRGIFDQGQRDSFKPKDTTGNEDEKP